MMFESVVLRVVSGSLIWLKVESSVSPPVNSLTTMPLFSLKYVLRTKSEMPSSVNLRESMPSLRSPKAMWLRSSPSVSGSNLLSKAKRPSFQSRLPIL